jgi:hypothetical protein
MVVVNETSMARSVVPSQRILDKVEYSEASHRASLSTEISFGHLPLPRYLDGEERSQHLSHPLGVGRAVEECVIIATGQCLHIDPLRRQIAAGPLG